MFNAYTSFSWFHYQRREERLRHSSGRGKSTLAMQMQDLQALYVHKLQDIYSAEQQALDLMEQSVGLAQTPELRQG
ncbi:DUF892 family protein, partial [uncultured Deinococcus sp.]|uniref:DUF892 family protein n=1 Tax=uncultured Deinococcus sp. TaxID=158789 RepID=UPI00338F3708